MEELKQVKSQAVATRLDLDAVQKVMQVQQRLLLAGLLVASLIAPIAMVVYPPSSKNSTNGSLNIFGTIELFFVNSDDFGVPKPRDTGLIVARILVVLLLIAVVCALVVIYEMRKSQKCGVRRALTTLGIILILMAGLIFYYLGNVGLPDYYLPVHGSGGLGFPIAAGVMALFHVWTLKQLD